MRNIAKAQPIGEAAFRETAHMDEGQQPIGPKVVPMTQANAGLPEWLDGNDLISLEAETPEVLIGGEDGGDDGAILRRGSKLVIGGGSKMGKTWCLIDLALSVAAGGKWLGRFQCRQGTVLYVNLELKGHTAGKRMRWIAEKRGLTRGTGLRPEVSKAIKTWNLRGQCYDIVEMLETARMRLVGNPDAPKFDLIILDPLYKTLGGKDENAAGDMAALMLELEQFADECKAAIAFAAHFSKGNQSGKESMDRISGSGVISRDPDAILTFTNHEEEDCFTMEAVLREFAPIAPLVLQWNAPVMNPRTDLDPTKLRQPGKSTDQTAKRLEAMRAVLQKAGRDMGSKELVMAAMVEGQDAHGSLGGWKRTLEKHQGDLADFGLERMPTANGQEARYKLRTHASKDPF